MKKLLYTCLMIITLVACKHKLSERDKSYIETVIGVHEMTVGLQYRLDSLSYGKQGLDYNNSQHMRDLHPYDPHTDPNLTYEKFIGYCEKNKLDPIKEAKYLASQEK
ncbi:MAG: hypothetical protein JWO92_2546 [Chitinophagaceae bacterium]|nr:hypothetical protein [Chitinophagaceae bacterium]